MTINNAECQKDKEKFLEYIYDEKNKEIIKEAFTLISKRKDTSKFTVVIKFKFGSNKIDEKIEYHIFDDKNNCLCGKIKYNIDDLESHYKNKLYINEFEIRTEAAFLGRRVCGTCVSHLYLTK